MLQTWARSIRKFRNVREPKIYLDLENLLGAEQLADLHEEICFGLASVEPFQANLNWRYCHNLNTEADAQFPLTSAWMQKLPFRKIDFAQICGILEHQSGTLPVDPEFFRKDFLVICPNNDMQFTLLDEDTLSTSIFASRILTFAPHNFVKVEPAHFFRYCLLVQGSYEYEFGKFVRGNWL